MWFMNTWNVGGVLQNPKNMTVGLNSPYDRGDKGSLPLVLFSDANVVVSPLNVKLGKQCGLFHVINEFRNEGKRVGILDCMGVQVVVILAWM